MNKTMKTKDIERIFNKHMRAYFDAIQEVLKEKETSTDVNLDIKFKVFTNVHQSILAVKEELFAKQKGGKK